MMAISDSAEVKLASGIYVDLYDKGQGVFQDTPDEWQPTYGNINSRYMDILISSWSKFHAKY